MPFASAISHLEKLSPTDGKRQAVEKPPRLQHVTPTSWTGAAAAPPVEAFYATRSRVVKLCNLPEAADAFLSALFNPHNASQLAPIPVPLTMWELREPTTQRSVWAVFRTHEEACAALPLSGRAMSVDTALEVDLEPFHKLQRFTPSLAFPTSRATLDLPSPSPMLRLSLSHSDLHAHRVPEMNTDYTLSTNPPNPKNSFRLGDWICNAPNCAAHNFGRNLACIGCGCPRSSNGAPLGSQTSTHSRAPPSPRFNSMGSSSAQPPPQPALGSSVPFPTNPTVSHLPSVPKASHPLLTPSGRAFAVGGKVQNVSNDPLNPCIMYWPDNEAFPDRGQIRPSHVVGVVQPPILNTGNRGPISHQPGDWICQKCNYLNWRRRKVCQTCLPYAEGNGDSISAAVQAERIALLTSVLSQTHLGSGHLQVPTANPALRSHSLTPPQIRRPYADAPSAQHVSSLQPNRSVHRSHSHLALGQQYANHPPHYTNPSPIYQTSGHRQPSPLYSTGPMGLEMKSMHSHHAENRFGGGLQAPAPLLPSFLQDIVQSPALSPTSTSNSSVDLSSIEEYEDAPATRAPFPRVRGDSGSEMNAPVSNIWRFDGEESKSLLAFPLPGSGGLLPHKASSERLRV